MSRFVVLRHQPGPRSMRGSEVHFDWMFEQGDGLATWATEPVRVPFPRTIQIAAQRLVDHRQSYLDYEGPVSGQRGTVQRVLAGNCNITLSSSSEFGASISWLSGETENSAAIRFHRTTVADSLDCDSAIWELELSRW